MHLKQTIGHALADNPKIKALALKVSAYPDFMRFQETFAVPELISGAPREKRNKASANGRRHKYRPPLRRPGHLACISMPWQNVCPLASPPASLSARSFSGCFGGRFCERTQTALHPPRPRAHCRRALHNRDGIRSRSSRSRQRTARRNRRQSRHQRHPKRSNPASQGFSHNKALIAQCAPSCSRTNGKRSGKTS